MKTLIPQLLFCIVLMSCAASYTAINPGQMNYTNTTNTDAINFATRSNVLAEAGNQRYANKETRRGIKLIALEIENKTDREIVLRNDARFYLGDNRVFPIEPSQIHQQLKQAAGVYMLWSLLWVVITKCENNDCSVIPLPVGFLIGIGNTSKASKANKLLLANLISNNILDRKISPGQKAVGLFGIASGQIDNFRIELE